MSASDKIIKDAKSKEEKNLRATARAFKAFRAGYREGMGSAALFAIFSETLREQLGEYEILYDYLVGEDTVKVDGKSGDRILRDGDVLLIDVSVGKDGVWSDVCRTYFVGEPPESRREVFEMVKRSLRGGESALKAGATADEIYAAANAEYEKSKKKLIHHAGHRIGEKALLQPQFLRGVKDRIRFGDFVTVETGLYEQFGLRLENDYLVTEDGAENLFERLLPLEIEEYILR